MANLVPFNGRRGLRQSGFEDFYNVLDDFFSDTWSPRRTKDIFKVDVQETDQEYLIEAELPGISKDEIKLSMNDGNLVIAAQRKENIDEENKSYIHRERRLCSMSRSVYLGDANAEGINAKLEDGILKITVPRQERKDHTKQIEIQ